MRSDERERRIGIGGAGTGIARAVLEPVPSTVDAPEAAPRLPIEG